MNGEDSARAGVEGCHSQHTPKGRAFRRMVRPSKAKRNCGFRNRYSPQVIDCQGRNWSVATMLPDKPNYEVVDAIELAQRWRVPVSWIREQTRERACDPLPCVRLGRYVRFEWGSPKLAQWWEKRRT